VSSLYLKIENLAQRDPFSVNCKRPLKSGRVNLKHFHITTLGDASRHGRFVWGGVLPIKITLKDITCRCKDLVNKVLFNLSRYLIAIPRRTGDDVAHSVPMLGPS
jgi:hypothetical protein